MKGKLQRYGLLVVVGLPLLLYLSLGLVYLEQKRGQSNAFAQVRTSLEALRQPVPDTKDVEAQIAQVDEGINEARGLFAQESDQLVAGLLEKAQNSGLRAVAVAAKPVVTRKEDTKSYTVLPISIQVVGETGQLMGFLNSLDYPSLQVENASLSQIDEGYNITLELAVRLTPKE